MRRWRNNMRYERINRMESARHSMRNGALLLCTALCALALGAPAEAKHTFTSFKIGNHADWPEAQSINATGVRAGYRWYVHDVRLCGLLWHLPLRHQCQGCCHGSLAG